MSLLDKYVAKYGHEDTIRKMKTVHKDWMPETPTSPEKESNRAAAHSLIDNMTDEDRKRSEEKSTLGQSLGMQTNGILGNAFASIFNKEENQKYKDYQTYKAASDILQAEKYEKKREDVVRQNGSYAYKTMKNYIDLIDKARQSRQGGGTLGALINSGKSEDLQKQAKEIKKTLEQMGITGKDFDKYEQYVREYKDIEDTQAMEKEIASKIAAKPVARGIGYTAADVAVSPITGLMATAESLKRPFYADPSAPVNTYSSLYALQNASNAVEQSVSNQIDSKLGKFAYGTGVSALKSGEAMLIGNYLGGAFGIDAASKLGQLTTLPMFGASAFAQTLQESQAKGFSPEMATQKALASGMAEMLFEELSLDKAWGTLKNAKLGKGGLSKRILDVFMGAGIEGSEEIFTDLANHIADNFINGDFSDYQSGIRMRVENGMSLDQATREAKKEFIAQLVESGLAGAASGGFMNVAAASVGSVQYHNTARNINENTKLKSEVVESAKGLEGTTAAEIANSKSVEEINENDMVEILHSMEEVTQKSAHDIAKESLMNAGETAEEAEKKANEIVIMSEQTQPTEAEEKRNIDLVKDENVANAYADVLKNRVASNVLEDVEKHNAEVKKIKDRVKGKEGIRAGYNNQEIKVYDFEDVQKGIVATSQGLLDLSEITLPEDMRLLFKNAHALENTKAANAFIDGYKGQSPSYYATGSLRAFMVGASGGSWESFINSKNPLNIKLIEEIGDNAYLKSMYFYGQNSRENAEAAKVETSKINPGKVTGENVLNPLLEPLAKKFNVAINTTEGRNKAAGSFVPSELLVTLNKAESNNMLNSVLHETLGEYTKAYAPDAYKLTKQKVIDFARKVFGDTEVDRQIRVYQNTYKGFGKQTGNTAESNKTFADASDEWFNDFMAGLAQTEYGLERVVNYVAEDNSMTATEKTSVLQSIKDIVKKILDTIKSYLQGVKSNNIGTKAAKEVEKNIDKYMADLEDIFDAVEKMCNAAIAEVNKQIAGEVEKAVKEVTEDYTETEHKQFSLNTDVESTKELMALHALNEESFLKTLKLGGFACPSIAIKKKYMSHSQFGDITVVFGKATIDPEWAEGNNVYSGDAWTPVFPTVEYKLNDKKRKQVADKITEAVGGYDVFRTLPNPMLDEVNMTDAFNHRGTETYKNDRTMQYAYLNDTGKGFDIPTKENQFMPGLVSNEALRKIVETIGADTINEAHDSSYSWYESHPEIVDKLRVLLNEGYRNSNKKPFADKADSELKVFQKNFQEKYKHWFDDEEGKLSWINYNKAIDALYAINKYGAYQVRDDEAFRNMLDEKVDETGYTEWLEKLFDGIIEKEGIRNNLDYYDSKGEPRTFNALHYEVTLENAVKVMKQQSQQGGTNTPFGAMQIWGVATRKFDSLEDIKKASARLVLENDEEREALREEYTQRFFDIAKEISDKKEDNQFIAMDRAGEAIVDSLRGAKTERAINNSLKQYSRLHITDHTAADVLALYNDIADMPTDYFEAKPTRAVGLNEIAYVVIPDNASERLIKALNDNGITYKTYEAENEEDRLKVVQENASEESGTVFSLNVETKEVEEATEKLTKQVDDWLQGIMPKKHYFDFGKTPYVLKVNGAKDLPVTMNESGILKFTTGYKEHSVSTDAMKEMPKAITRPLMVFKGSVPNSLALVVDVNDKKEEKIVVAIHLDDRQNRLLVNRIASMYGKDNTINYALRQIKEGNLLDIDKKRSIEWLTSGGLQLPRLVQANINASKDTIAQIEQQSNNESHSLNVDSQGSSLSPEQAEFFKDSKARDDEGRLLVMYHGTDAYKDFTVFKPGKNGYLGKGMYFTEKKYIAEKYAEQNGYDGRVYQVYLNIKNPLVVTSDNPALEILGEKVAARRAMENSYSTRWLKPGDISKLKAKGYDGIIWKYGKSPIEISVWEPNQVKNTDNLKPTENEDIRYSLNVDSEGKELTEAQEKYFADSKIRDAEGKLLVMYHGTNKGGFTVFDASFSDDNLSFFFSDKVTVSAGYVKNRNNREINLNKPIPKDIKTAQQAYEYLESLGYKDIQLEEVENPFSDDTYDVWTFVTPEGHYDVLEYGEGALVDYVKELNQGIYPVYLNVKNPLVVEANGKTWDTLEPPEKYSKHYSNVKILDGFNDNKIIKVSYTERLKNGEIKYHTNEDFTIDEIKEVFGEDTYNTYVENNLKFTYFRNVYLDEKSNILPSTTRQYAKYAKEKGYDGVYFKNIVDVNTDYEEAALSNVAVAFESNQIKSIHNARPTENADIRYSLDVEDWEKDFFAEMTGNANVSNILTEGLKSLDNIKLNKKITDKIAREVREEYKSRIKVADLSDSLEKVFSYMLDTGAPSYGDLVNIMKEVAMPVVEQATEIMPEEKRIWDDFKEKMKGYRIKLNPQQKAEVANTFGTYYAFKNDMFGNLIFSESGTDLDSIWTEICDASGGYLDYAENPANQPMALYEFVEALKPTPANIYGANQEEAAYDVALTIFRKFLVEQEYENNPKLRKEALKLTEAQQTYKKRIKENYDKKFKEATESLRREKEINMKRLATEIKYLNEEEKAAIEGSIEQALILRQKRQYEWRLQKLRETKNDEINRKLSELKARQRASISRRVEGRQLTLAKAKIRKNVEKLNSMLAHGTENRHIPKNMVLSTIAMLESIDINTGNSKGMAEYLQKMEDIYRGFKDSDVYTDGEKAASFDYDERTAANIEALRKLFDGRNYTQLSLSELQQVIDITNAVITQAENANKLLGKEKREYATDVARAAALEVRNAKVKDSRFMTNLDHYMTQHLNAYREFRKLSGYEDGKLMDLYYDLDKGQQKQLQVMKDINAIFDDVLKDQKEVKRLTSTDKKDLVDSGLKDENGNPVMITRAQRLSLVMHSYNKSNMQHLLYGGISVPDLSYKDPKQQRAHAQTYFYESQMELRDAILDKNANKLDLIEQRATMKVKELEKQLSPWEKQFLEATKEMFWKTTGRLINETSLELKGYTLARVANYFPIKTDTDYTKSDVSGLIFDGTIEGMGFLKERRFGRNAMMLEDITDTILRQTQSVAKYVGLAIPVRNFNMVWNTVTRSPMGNADTLKKAISLTWGAKNTDYIVNLMKDLNGRRDGGELSFLDELRGKFAGAVLTLNPSVAIKQAASFFTAGAKVGNLTLAKTLKDLGKGFILKKGIPELEAINPLLWYRNQGNATQELADMKAVGFGKNLPIWAQKALNWVEFMDTGTVRTLEYAAKNYVDANFKDLKGAEYWQKVSDVFTSIVEETQPNYTVLQQADIIRNPNRLLKAVVMFKTQPLQNFGTVYDAVGEYAAKVRKGNKAEIKEAGKHLAWALSSQIASAITFSAMTILADMILHKQYKYKDDDKSFWEMILAKFGAGVRDCFLGAMLFAQELYEAFDYLFNPDTKQYYGMDVSFLGQIEDIFKAVKNLNKNIGERADAITEADRDKYNNGILKETGNLVNYIGQFSGIPLGNIKNMAQSLILYAIDISNGTIGEAELSKDVPNQYERMYDALQNKDSERYNTLFDEMVTKKMRDAAEDGKEKDQEDIEKSVETSAKKYIKDGYNSGELTYDEAYTILTKEFGMEEDDAYFKLDEWLYKSEGHEDYTRYIRLSDAVNGQGDIQAEIDKLKAQGIEEDTIKSQLTGILKEGYYKGSLSNDKITQVLKEYEDLDENDIYYKFKEWDFKKTHPDESFSRYDAMNNAIKEVINGSDNRKPMIAEIKDLMKHGVEAKSLQSQLTKEYKPLYLELKAKGKASTLKNILISAYMATGLSQEDAAKRIDRWKENDK